MVSGIRKVEQIVVSVCVCANASVSVQIAHWELLEFNQSRSRDNRCFENKSSLIFDFFFLSNQLFCRIFRIALRLNGHQKKQCHLTESFAGGEIFSSVAMCEQMR